MFHKLKKKVQELFNKKEVIEEVESPKCEETPKEQSREDFSNVSNSIKCPSCRQSMIGEVGKGHIVHIKSSTFRHSLYLLEEGCEIIPTPQHDEQDFALKVYESVNRYLGDGAEGFDDKVSEIYLQPNLELEITCPLCFECHSAQEWVIASKDTSTMDECIICGASTEMEISSQNTTYVCSGPKTHRVSMAH